MKKACLLLALCAALTALSCSKEDKQSFASVDHDKDGGIIFEEMAFVYPDVVVENFAAYDANQNGSLEQDEYQAFHKDVVVDKKPPRAAKLTPAPVQAQKPAVQAVQPDITVTLEPEKAPEKTAPPAKAAETKAPAKAPEAKAPERQGPGQYTIQRGDNLTKIAKKHNVTVEDILKANEGLSADTIRDGQVIAIPAR